MRKGSRRQSVARAAVAVVAVAAVAVAVVIWGGQFSALSEVTWTYLGR